MMVAANQELVACLSSEGNDRLKRENRKLRLKFFLSFKKKTAPSPLVSLSTELFMPKFELTKRESGI
tara:strand:- start:334 stop:534 length:201 start_codon:yes stop_codon:yes gene_type:complete